MMYTIRDREAGNKIDSFDTMEEAMETLKAYEEEDRKDGSYTENFYEIIEEPQTRLDEFKQMLEQIEQADSWDAYPEYWEKLCDWYEIDIHDNEKYGDPEDVFNAIKEAIEAEEAN